MFAERKKSQTQIRTTITVWMCVDDSFRIIKKRDARWSARWIWPRAKSIILAMCTLCRGKTNTIHIRAIPICCIQSAVGSVVLIPFKLNSATIEVAAMFLCCVRLHARELSTHILFTSFALKCLWKRKLNAINTSKCDVMQTYIVYFVRSKMNQAGVRMCVCVFEPQKF